MTFDLGFSRIDGAHQQLTLAPGQTLFVLGANGTGKSSLMYR